MVRLGVSVHAAMRIDLVSKYTEKHPFRPFPCRIQIKIEGLEWAMYNRTAAYDHIVSELGLRNPQPGTPAGMSTNGRGTPVQDVFAKPISRQGKCVCTYDEHILNLYHAPRYCDIPAFLDGTDFRAASPALARTHLGLGASAAAPAGSQRASPRRTGNHQGGHHVR